MGQLHAGRAAISTTCRSTTGSRRVRARRARARRSAGCSTPRTPSEYGADTKRPGGAQPPLPARLPAERQAASRSSASRTSASTSTAATSSSRRRSPSCSPTSPARLVDAVDQDESNGTRLDDVLNARAHEDRDRGSGDPRAAVRGPAQSRLLGRGLRRAEADGDHPARRRPQHEAAAPVREPVLEHGGPGEVDRQRLHRHRHPEHLGRHARARRAPPGSWSTTPAASIAGGFHPSTPVLECVDEPAGDGIREVVPPELENVFPGITQAVERQGDALDAVPRPAPQLLVLVLERRAVHVVLAATRACRRATSTSPASTCSQDFQGFMEGGASEGMRAADEVLAAQS